MLPSHNDWFRSQYPLHTLCSPCLNRSTLTKHFYIHIDTRLYTHIGSDSLRIWALIYLVLKPGFIAYFHTDIFFSYLLFLLPPLFPALFFLIFFSLSLLSSFSFSFEIMVSLCYSWVAITGFISMCHHERFCSYLLMFAYILILWTILNSLPFVQGHY